MASYREPLFDDLPLEPRPEPNHEPETLQKAVAIANPATVKIPAPEPRELAPRGMAEHDGPTRDEILLTALTIIARKEPQTPATRGAIRDLIRRHSVECGLGF